MVECLFTQNILKFYRITHLYFVLFLFFSIHNLRFAWVECRNWMTGSYNLQSKQQQKIEQS